MIGNCLTGGQERELEDMRVKVSRWRCEAQVIIIFIYLSSVLCVR